MLSICIPSYNRPSELERLLLSIKEIKSDDIEVVISDDASPNQNLIDDVVNKYTNHLNIKYIPRSTNLGYDLNLIFLAENASYEYMMFIGDDDFIEPSNMKHFLSKLSSAKSSLIITPVFGLSGALRRNFANSFFKEDLSRYDLAKLAYECVLFSGLVFRSKKFSNLEIKELENSIYIQIYCSLVIASDSGFEYIDTPLIHVGNDGANGFGNNNSHDSDLKDRSDLFSDFNYHVRLKEVINIFSNRFSNIRPYYSFLYNIRLINRFSIIALSDKYLLKELTEVLLNKNLSSKFYVKSLFIFFKFLPKPVLKTFGKIKFLYYSFESKRKKI